MCTIGSGAPASWLHPAQHLLSAGRTLPLYGLFMLTAFHSSHPILSQPTQSWWLLLWAFLSSRHWSQSHISEEHPGYWKRDQRLAFTVTESRGILQKTTRTEPGDISSSSKCGLCVTWLATTCLCFSIYQKQLGGLNWSWKIIWKSNEATQEKKKK